MKISKKNMRSAKSHKSLTFSATGVGAGLDTVADTVEDFFLPNLGLKK